MYICDVTELVKLDGETDLKHRLLVRYNGSWYTRHTNAISYYDGVPPEEDEVTLLVSSPDGKFVIAFEFDNQEQRAYANTAFASLYPSSSSDSS